MIKRIGTDGCKDCSLYINQNEGKVVKNWINTDCEIAFLGLGPGREEQKSCNPFIGDAGKKLRDAIKKSGIDDKDCSFINSVLCWPPDNKINESMTKPCSHHFHESMLEMPNLKLVVVLGADAYKFLFNEKPTMKKVYLTKIQHEKYPNILFIPNYHPSYILRQPSAENIKLFYDGIKYAIEIMKANKKLIKQKKVVIIKNKEVLYKAIELIKTKKILAFDSEATSLKEHLAKLICFSITYESDTAIVFPFMKPDSTNTKLVYYWEKEELIAIKRFLEYICSDPKYSLVLHNSKFDSKILYYAFKHNDGEPFIKNVRFDSMLGSFVLDSNNKANLESCVIREIPENSGYKGDFWADVSESSLEDGTWIFYKDYEKVLTYVADDSINTFELAKIFSKQM